MKLLLTLAFIGVITIQSPWMLNGELERPRECGDCLWWDEWGEHHDCPREVCPPPNWTAYWFNAVGDICNDPHLTGQPELKLTTDPTRVYSGHQAAQWFTFYRCHRVGMFQTFSFDGPGVFKASVKYHSYYSSCDSDPYSTVPLDKDCNPITDPYWQMYGLIGLDLLAGSDPNARLINWSNRGFCYGQWCTLETPPMYTKSSITLFVETMATAPLKHNDAFVDNIIFEKIQ